MQTIIFIITDNIIFWNLLKPLITRKMPRANVQVCQTYEEINSKIDSRNCDLILLDGGITSFSSIEAIQYLRMKRQILAPIWFFPEIQTDQYIHESKVMGVNQIIHKPFDPYVISTEISNLFIKQSS